MRVPPLVNRIGIPRPARAQDEDLDGGHKESHRSQNLLSSQGDSGGDVSTRSQRHWRLDIRGEASEIGGESLRF